MKLPPISEKQFMRQIIDIARVRGFLVAHFRPARTARGSWRTPVQADGKGFPDLVMVRARDRRVIFAEVKSTSGKLTVEQIMWMSNLGAAGAETYVWTPANWPAIEERLR